MASTYSQDSDCISIKVIVGDGDETVLEVKRDEGVHTTLSEAFGDTGLTLDVTPESTILFGEEVIESGASFSDYGIEAGGRLIITSASGDRWWLATFDLFDRDADGVLSTEELIHFVAFNFDKTADQVSPRQLSTMLEQLDADGDGEVSKADFMGNMMEGRGSHNKEDVPAARAGYEAARAYAAANFL